MGFCKKADKIMGGFIDQTATQVLKDFSTSPQGLSAEESQKRIAQYGKNELAPKKAKNPFILFLSQFRSFIIYILIGATIVSAFINEYIDAAVIFAILIINAILGFIQEYKAEKSIEALRKMASLKAKVLRDGKKTEIDATHLVPGDIILLETGDKIPADARIIEEKNLEAAESSLTGESAPVSKDPGTLVANTPIADQKNMVFAGTVVTLGRGTAVVVATGMATQMGHIARMIQETEKDDTPLQEKLDKLGKFLGYAVLGICALVFVLGIFRSSEILSHIVSGSSLIVILMSMKEIFMTSIALAVAAVPEGLAAIVTVSLALGVQRMVKKHALIRKLPSVETLGCTTVICTDKTGTLTRNEMTVRNIFINNKDITVTGAGYDFEGEFLHGGHPVSANEPALLLRIGALNNDAAIEAGKVIGDPTEGSLIVTAAKAGLSKSELDQRFPRKDEICFDSERKMMSTLHTIDGKDVVYVKGAPDVVLGKCSKIMLNGNINEMTSDDRERIRNMNGRYSDQALRVLAFAFRDHSGRNIKEENLTFVGLQAMIDPPRKSAKEAIIKCKEAGIRVIMITGDYIKTAQAIGKELGLTGKAIRGRELDQLEDLNGVVEDIAIYARVNPEHKMRIVSALKNKNHVVAMTGDGVNDAPALKNADIGIAMGITGTDVSKEASDMILTDDNFASIVRAVEEGRGIDDNIRKFVNYLLSSNMGEVLVIFIAMLIGFSFDGALVIPLTAAMLLWLNIVTDGLPALALGIDPIDPHIMKRPPRDPKAPILSKNMLTNIVFTGILLCVFTLVLFKIGLGTSVEKGRTMAFTALVAFQIVRIYMVRSQYHAGLFTNGFLWLAIGISGMLQLFAVYAGMFLPTNLFGTTGLGWSDWSYILGASASMLALGLIAGPIIRKWTKEID